MPSRKKPEPVETQDDFDPESPAPSARIIEFYQDTERYRIEIDGKHRFTFGPLAPGSRRDELCLRIYEGANKDNQIAVFPNVTQVRDISLPMVKVMLPENVGTWDKFAKQERQLVFAAFDVITAHATPGMPGMKEAIDKLQSLTMPLIQHSAPGDEGPPPDVL